MEHDASSNAPAHIGSRLTAPKILRRATKRTVYFVARTCYPSRVNRNQAIERLRKETFDVLVIGGGITGCGIALDAASRGLRVGLLERDDFSSGTSSKSSKLIHGGLR